MNKFTNLIITSVLSLVMLLPLANTKAGAYFTPAPRATFTSPSYGYSSSADYVNATFNLNLNGHPGLTHKTLYVYPVICNYMFISAYGNTHCELDGNSGTYAYFTDTYSNQSLSFPNVAMQYLG